MAFPLVVIGVNSIAAYCIAHFMEGFLEARCEFIFGRTSFSLPERGCNHFFGCGDSSVLLVDSVLDVSRNYS